MKRVLIILVLLVNFGGQLSATSTTTTTQYSDGRIETTQTFSGIRAPTSALAILVVSIAVLGGIGISVYGVITISNAMKQKRDNHATDLEVDLSKKSMKLTKVSQGVIVCLFGAAIIILSVQQLGTLLVDNSEMVEVVGSQEMAVGTMAGSEDGRMALGTIADSEDGNSIEAYEKTTK